MDKMERIWQNLWKRKKKKFSRESEPQEVEDKENDSPTGRGEGEVERIIIKSSGNLSALSLSTMKDLNCKSFSSRGE